MRAQSEAIARLAAPDDALVRHEYRQIVMGIEARVVVYAGHEAWARDAADAAFARLHELDASFSNYRDDSELARLMAAEPGEHVEVSCELMSVLIGARYMNGVTRGAFDVTAAPLFELWREARAVGLPPEAALVDAALSSRSPSSYGVFSGWECPDRECGVSCYAELLQRGLRIDLGGIAKGYAVDRALDVLRSRSLERALVQVGGDLAVGAAPPRQGAWSIEIGCGEGPLPPPRIAVENVSVSTCGDSEQHFVYEGVRYSHVVDPRTGQALSDPLCVTVVASRGDVSDPLATAARVLGRQAAVELLRDPRLARSSPHLFVDGEPWLQPSTDAAPTPWRDLLADDLAAWELVDDGAPADTPARALDPAWLRDGVLGIPSSAPSGWLRTRDDVGDFQLRLDFKLARMANGGVFLRAARDGSNPAYSGCEVQLLDDHNWEAETRSKLREWQFTGSLYGAVAPADRAAFGGPGTWNTLELLYEGSRLAAMLNGRLLYDVDTHALDVDPPFAERATRGAIGLQRYAAPGVGGDVAVWVRHAFLREL